MSFTLDTSRTCPYAEGRISPRLKMFDAVSLECMARVKDVPCVRGDGIEVERVVIRQQHDRIRRGDLLGRGVDQCDATHNIGVEDVGINRPHLCTRGQQLLRHRRRGRFPGVTRIALVRHSQQQDTGTPAMLCHLG